MGFWRSNTALILGDGRSSRKFLNTERLERFEYLEKLGARAWYEGSHLGERIYRVAVFDKVAVADCPEWGNALYYCGSQNGRWRQVFRLTKAEALNAGARRLVHSGDWRGRLSRIVRHGVTN